MKHFITVTGLTENQFANEVGISQNFIDQVNSGMKFIGDRSRKRLAEHFSVSCSAVDKLLEIENEKEFFLKLIIFQLSNQPTKRLQALSNLIRFM